MGVRSFSCIDAVHNRAMRFFLGVGKYSSNSAVVGEMAWQPPIVRQWKTVVTLWARIGNTSPTRINKRIMSWAKINLVILTENWFYIVKNKLRACNLGQYCNINEPLPKHTLVQQTVQCLH